MNVVFIGAHPDDEMFCLGTLLLYRKRGDQVSLICATNGDKGISDDPDFPHAECARLRDLEMRPAAHAALRNYGRGRVLAGTAFIEDRAARSGRAA